MTILRPALALAAMLLPVVLVASPAAAAGKHCASHELAERCGVMSGRDDAVNADVVIYAERDRVRVRVARSTLQRRTADGWVAVTSTVPPVHWARGSYSANARVLCDDAVGGRYRATGIVTWKLGAHGEVKTRRITSDPVRRSRLCG